MFSSPDFIAIYIFLFGLAGSFFVIRWIFKPLYDAQVSPRQPAHFYTSDFYALILPLVLAGMLIFKPHSKNYPGYNSDISIMLTTTVVSAIFWWRGTVLLSRAAIVAPWRRFIFLALFMPLALSGSIAAVAMPLMVGYFFIGVIDLVGALMGTLVLPVWVAICSAVLWILRLAAHWTLRGRAASE